MKPIAIIYANREGHTRRIAEHMISTLTHLGYTCCAWNLRDHPRLDLSRHSAAILAASVHAGNHEPEILEFVEYHLHELERIPNAFLSVTLSQAGVERAGQSAEAAARCQKDVNEVLERFVEETGWRPQNIKAIAGALAYSKYNFLTRFLMKRVARKEGADTDTSRDYEYTDWNGLARFVAGFARTLREVAEPDPAFPFQRHSSATA